MVSEQVQYLGHGFACADPRMVANQGLQHGQAVLASERIEQENLEMLVERAALVRRHLPHQVQTGTGYQV
jgi:hypothetical protein